MCRYLQAYRQTDSYRCLGLFWAFKPFGVSTAFEPNYWDFKSPKAWIFQLNPNRFIHYWYWINGKNNIPLTCPLTLQRMEVVIQKWEGERVVLHELKKFQPNSKSNVVHSPINRKYSIDVNRFEIELECVCIRSIYWADNSECQRIWARICERVHLNFNSECIACSLSISLICVLLICAQAHGRKNIVFLLAAK